MKSGDIIGQYEIESILGRGGMGTVYAVKHRVLGGRHALKVLNPEVAESPEGRERFRREARVMHDLGKAHEHILEVEEYGEEADGTLWLRMPMMSGMPGKDGKRYITLRDRMDAEGRLPEKEVKGLLSEILGGIGYAHRQGALHRDLKPANILLNDDGSVRIADFGLVKVVEGEWLRSQFEKSIAKTAGFGNTRHEGEADPGASTEALVGTWAYLAPEVKKGAEASIASDLWAVGLLAFQLLTSDESPGFDLPSRLVPGIDPKWDEWIRTATAKDPAERFGSAAAFFQVGSPSGEEKQPVDTGEAKPEISNEKTTAQDARSVEPGPASASNERRFVNSLGMNFVPVAIGNGPSAEQTVLFSIWETRVRDFRAFVESTGYDGGGDPVESKDRWLNVEYKRHAQTPDHPVVNVNWEDAKAFCAWLTEAERAAGSIGPRDECRLPSDVEWSWAVGIGDREDPEAKPKEKGGKIENIFPWGSQWPPPPNAGNFSGQESASNYKIGEYRDDHAFTSPVGSYPADRNGLHDLSGNVWEWCEDWYSEEQKFRVLRGGSWRSLVTEVALRSSNRYYGAPTGRRDVFGFRVVVVAGAGG